MGNLFRANVGGGGGNAPDGKTIEPINDVTIWLRCASIISDYTTLEQVVNDTHLLLYLISNNNACDYLERSNQFVSICNDDNAMTYIGFSDYCCNLLTNNETWVNAISESPYYSNVLNKSIVRMTSNTTPIGIVTASGENKPAWNAFDNDDNTYWSADPTVFVNQWVQYEFPEAVCINKMEVTTHVRNGVQRVKNIKLLASDTGRFTGEEVVLREETLPLNPIDTRYEFSVKNVTNYKYYRLQVVDGYSPITIEVTRLQLYGRVSK